MGKLSVHVTYEAMPLERRHILWNVPFDTLSLKETISEVERIIQERKPKQHTVINAAKIVKAQQDLFLKQCIGESELVNIDGQAVVWAARVLGIEVPERVTGIDLMWALMSVGNEKGWRIYLFGARDEILTALMKRIRVEFPGLVIAGYRNGYFTPDEAEGIAQAIAESHSDILFVALPTPMKEKFIQKYHRMMNVPFAMGVGGSFDVLAGKVRRAPVWVQKMGLEWFFRLAQEPRRLFLRYAITNFQFLWLVGRECLARRSNKSKKYEASNTNL